MVLDALAKRELSQIAGGMFNDLESAAVALHPEAAQVKAWMGQLGLTGVVLAGSGSSWVGWMMAPRAYAGLATQAGARGWRVFRVQPTRRGWSEEKSSTHHARRQGRAAQRYLGEQ